MINKNSYKEGDIFAIRIGEERFCYGRIIKERKEKSLIVEVFEEVTGELVSNTEEVVGDRLFDPVYVTPEPFRDGEWLTVASDEDYECEDADEIKFAIGDDVIGYRIREGIGPNQTERRASKEEVQDLEETVIWYYKALEDRIREALEEQGKLE